MFQQSYAERRGAGRFSLGVRAAFRERGKQMVPTLVTDIAVGGARLKTDNTPPLGTLVWLKLPELESLYSQIIWIGRGQIGLSFPTRLHPAVVDRLFRGVEPQTAWAQPANEGSW